jgi:O-antigen/teichoic acid export membrane protein
VKEPYLRALGYITVFFWPALVLLAILAYPAVLLLLGHQWLGAVPLLQVMAVAGLAWFPVMLTSPVLLAVGANRDRVLAVLITRAVSGFVLCCAAYFGVMAMALSRLATLPFQMIVSLWFVRRQVAFAWSEVSAAVWKSAVVTASSAAGPICVVALSDSGFNLPIGATGAAVLLAAVGWLVGALATRHPALLEVRKLIDAIVATSLAQRCGRLRDRLAA